MHKTAMSRSALSRPMRAFLPYMSRSHLDYGCGRGDDVRLINGMGQVSAYGYDPNNEKYSRIPIGTYDTVSLIYVLNVIKEYDERVATLRAAYKLADKTLLIACRVDSVKGVDSGDGVITSRGTFQTQLTNQDWFEFLRSVLDCEVSVLDRCGIYIVRKP